MKQAFIRVYQHAGTNKWQVVVFDGKCHEHPIKWKQFDDAYATGKAIAMRREDLGQEVEFSIWSNKNQKPVTLQHWR